MRRKLLLLLIIIIATGATYYLVTPSGPSVSLTKVYNVQEGQNIKVNITLSDVNDLIAFSIFLTWDPYILKVETGDPNGWLDPTTQFTTRTRYNIYEGPFFKKFTNSTRFIMQQVKNSQGKIDYLHVGMLTYEVPASGSGVVATIEFKCLRTGTTTIEITSSALENTQQTKTPHRTIYGLVTEMGPSPIWTEPTFQTTVILVEITGLAIVTTTLLMVRELKKKSLETKPTAVEEELFE